MTETKIVSADVAGVEEAITFVEGYLSMHGIKKKTLRRVALTAEESVSSLAAHAHPQSEIRIWLRSPVSYGSRTCPNLGGSEFG